MTLKELQEKIHKDYEELVNRGNEDYKYFLQHAYAFAHYNEIDDFFDNLNGDEWEDNWTEIVGVIKEEVNIVEGIYDSWLNYNHPEYYNFFTYEDLIDIMKYYFKHIY